MEQTKLWARFFDHHKNPCFITDVETGTLLYANPEFFHLYGLNEDVIGKAYYDVIDPSNVHTDKEFPNWNQQEVFDTESYNKQLNMRFTVHASKLDNKNHIFTEMMSVDHDLHANSIFEEACLAVWRFTTNPLTR